MSTVVISRESCYTSLPEFVSRNVGRTNSSQEKPKSKSHIKKTLSSPSSSSTSPLSREAHSVNSPAESPKTSLPTNGNKLNSSTLPATPTEIPSALLTATKRLSSVNRDFVSSGMFRFWCLLANVDSSTSTRSMQGHPEVHLGF